MQHQQIDLKPYMDEILTLADGAIEAVIRDKIVKDGKVQAGDHKAIDMLHHQIELELASTWEKASAKRALAVRLSHVQERVEARIKIYPVSDEIYFSSCEEQSLAAEIFKKRGYKTSFVSDEGMYGVKYLTADELTIKHNLDYSDHPNDRVPIDQVDLRREYPKLYRGV